MEGLEGYVRNVGSGGQCQVIPGPKAGYAIGVEFEDQLGLELRW